MAEAWERMATEMLADAESDLREQVRAYRELARAAIHRLAAQQQTIDRQRETIAALRQELRAHHGRPAA